MSRPRRRNTSQQHGPSGRERHATPKRALPTHIELFDDSRAARLALRRDARWVDSLARVQTRAPLPVQKGRDDGMRGLGSCAEGRGDDGEKNGAPHRGLGRGSFFFCWEAPRVRG